MAQCVRDSLTDKKDRILSYLITYQAQLSNPRPKPCGPSILKLTAQAITVDSMVIYCIEGLRSFRHGIHGKTQKNT